MCCRLYMKGRFFMQQSFEDQLVEHLPQIRKIIYKISGDQRVVDDLSQECCLRIIEKEKLWSGSKFKQWANAVTRNLTIDLLIRKKKREKTSDLIDEKEDPKSCDKQRQLELEDEVNKILKHYDELPSRQREMVNLYYHQNKSVTEIAKELGVSQPAVSIQLSRALKKLKGQQQFKLSGKKIIMVMSLIFCVSVVGISFFGDNIRGLFVDSSSRLQGDNTTKSNDGKDSGTADREKTLDKAESEKGLGNY